MQFYILLSLLFVLPLTLLIADAPKTDTKTAPKIIIILGAPASGKGTQAVQVAKALHIPHISTGDLLRENVGKNTALGIKAKTFMESGKLVPDDLVLAMLFERISAPDAVNGYVLDGFPRTLPQAEELQKKLPPTAKIYVLNLDVSDDTIMKRALGRKRSDDTPEVVKERLKNYHAQTAPLVDYYAKKQLLQNVDGEKTPDEVFQQLTTLLKAN